MGLEMGRLGPVQGTESGCGVLRMLLLKFSILFYKRKDKKRKMMTLNSVFESHKVVGTS